MRALFPLLGLLLVTATLGVAIASPVEGPTANGPRAEVMVNASYVPPLPVVGQVCIYAGFDPVDANVAPC